MLDVLCLTLNLYFEARGEPLDGQILVAEVTMNRAEKEGEGVCRAVFRPSQFSWTAEENLSIKEFDAFKTSFVLAREMLDTGCVLCSGATHYHNTSVKPYWSKSLTKLGKYGNHIFYME